MTPNASATYVVAELYTNAHTALDFGLALMCHLAGMQDVPSPARNKSTASEASSGGSSSGDEDHPRSPRTGSRIDSGTGGRGRGASASRVHSASSLRSTSGGDGVGGHRAASEVARMDKAARLGKAKLLKSRSKKMREFVRAKRAPDSNDWDEPGVDLTDGIPSSMRIGAPDPSSGGDDLERDGVVATAAGGASSSSVSRASSLSLSVGGNATPTAEATTSPRMSSEEVREWVNDLRGRMIQKKKGSPQKAARGSVSDAVLGSPIHLAHPLSFTPHSPRSSNSSVPADVLTPDPQAGRSFVTDLTARSCPLGYARVTSDHLR